MDFLSDGQLDHFLTQAETPFEQLFEQLAVRRELRARAGSWSSAAARSATSGWTCRARRNAGSAR